MRTLLLALTPMLAACVATPDAPSDNLDLEGKGDGKSSVRSATLVVDRRPVDGPLVEIHILPAGNNGASVVVDYTTMSRAGTTHRREVLIENGSCGMGLDEIMCEEDPDVADFLFTAVRAGDTWTATTSVDGESNDLASGLRAKHLRFSRAEQASRLLVELTIDTGTNGSAVTLRKTPTDGREIHFEPNRLMTAGACKLDAGELTCVEDRRPVDGALTELRVTLVTPAGPYAATLRRSGQRLDGQTYDNTETLASELDFR
jgi:hypothetical protein